MKERMFKYFSANSTRRYIDILDDLVDRYNNTKHSSIKMTPVEASKKTNERKVFNREEIQGSFYEQELQKTSQEIFRIEKIIERRGKKSLVKYLGYPDTFNTWVDNKDLIGLR